MGIEADTGSPWEPSKMLSRDSVLRDASAASTTPLTNMTEDGKFVPYLAESVEPNADYTVWTIKARAGVTFHDGTPFNGAAIADNIEAPAGVVPHRRGLQRRGDEP